MLQQWQQNSLNKVLTMVAHGNNPCMAYFLLGNKKARSQVMIMNSVFT